MLKPIRHFPDPARTNGVLVLCEVMMPDGVTPHESNKRATILDDEGAWFGFEQEYFLYQNGRPLGFPESGYPAPQGPYYCGVGASNVGPVARKIVEEHLDLCLAARHQPRGHQRRGGQGQWEFQIFGKGSKKAADEMWMARYLLQRLCEQYDSTSSTIASRSATPTGTARACTATYSTAHLREVGGKAYFEALMAAFEKNLHDHIAVYGPDNDKPDRQARDGALEQVSLRRGRPRRLGPRAALLREERLQGYLEDRRPNSMGDPYQIASQVLKTISEVPTGAAAAAAAA